ncbi:hypothetical protein M404DRAFT_864725 [Pisolithus tinctorius Marx 270]|uniref:Uncharacterized protein n=1 Tax=Pisolithus tinctorius Marx 270 TaxID=870435 RepID=A0A0C3JK80_PISTI|nr:hypothetical protein M404DRAFT_864725 [Pisolithus tinctorius Marx 270]
MKKGMRTAPPSSSHPGLVRPLRPYLSLAPSTSLYASSLNVLVSIPHPPRSSHRRASYSVPLVWYNLSLLSPPLFARLHLRAQRASPRRPECGVEWMR